jgi:hypothetical protein
MDSNIEKELYDKSVGKLINQFPYESCFVMKHNLARTITNMYGYVSWLQRTYDLD